MAKEQYEIEVKSLLGSPESAQALRAKLAEIDPNVTLRSSYTQLNHYFEGGDPKALEPVIAPLLTTEEAEQMRMILERGSKISVRTREMNSEAKFVMKASIGEDSSANGVARAELEAIVPDTSLEDLDKLVLNAGYAYQAKWSRSREEYALGDINVCLDKNAGYGYLAEFEKVIENEAQASSARSDIDALMERLGVTELGQDRLERMFAYYNEHWPEYYGTENIFTVQ